MPPIELDGRSLDLARFLAVARGGAPVSVRSWEAVEAGRGWLEEQVSGWRAGQPSAPIYGVTTGFGSSRNVRLSAADVESAQVNLLRSHAIGVAVAPDDWFDDEVVRGAALLRINTFLAGRSGVRRVLVERLVALLNAGVHPRVPQRGSVGASGDLCPLAHFALVLIGEGHASIRQPSGRVVVSGAAALAAAGLEPLALSYKEGLALINGTTMSTSCLALAVADSERVAEAADIACALGLEALGALGRALDPKVHAARNQVGQQDSAQAMRRLTEGSRRISATDDKQDVYSYRCAPQVHGASRDALSHAKRVVEAELNAVTDNPLFFALADDGEPWDLEEHGANPLRFGREPERNRAYSAGNFHGQPVAIAADLACIALAGLANVSERRTAILVNPATSRGLPAHLAVRVGVQSGVMLAQYTAASLVSELKTLAHPASVDSIPTGNGAEDHVPMATWAARKARTAAALTLRVLALELIVAAQANEWRSVLPDPSVSRPAGGSDDGETAGRAFGALDAADVARELGHGTGEAYRALRGLTARVIDDRSLAGDVETVAAAVVDGRMGAATAGRTLPLRAYAPVA